MHRLRCMFIDLSRCPRSNLPRYIQTYMHTFSFIYVECVGCSKWKQTSTLKLTYNPILWGIRSQPISPEAEMIPLDHAARPNKILLLHVHTYILAKVLHTCHKKPNVVGTNFPHKRVHFVFKKLSFKPRCDTADKCCPSKSVLAWFMPVLVLQIWEMRDNVGDRAQSGHPDCPLIVFKILFRLPSQNVHTYS
jgi:hypothetical protein